MIQLREASQDDVGFINGLADSLAAVFGLPWLPAEATDAFAAAGCRAAAVAIGHPDQLVMIAVDDADTVLGFVHTTLERSVFTGETVGYVSTVAVAPAARRRGVARTLMTAAEQWARDRGATLITLEVFAGNATARSVYAQLGYAEQTLKLAKPISGARSDSAT